MPLYGVHNQSAEVLGFQSKMNQLKNEELLLVQLRKELETGLALKQELLALRTESEAGRKAIASAQIASEEGMTKVREKLDETTAISQSAAALALVVQQNETTTLNVAATAKTSGAEVQAVEARIKEFFAQIDAYRVKIDTVSTDARNCIDGNKTEMEKLVSNLSNLEDQIKKQIERATGFSLFHSFQTRQDKITWAKRFWGVMLAIVICASVGLTAYIAHSTTVFDIGFYLKLSMSVPLIFALSFCTIQYSRERRLEEEYAFRSSISISLDPYQELVSRLIDKAQPEERQKFTAFLIDSIQRVFTSPTERIFEPKDKSKAATEKSLKLLAEIAGQFSKAAKG